MKKRKAKNKFNISNKLAYTLIALSCIILLGIGVYAYGGTVPATMGHSAGEISLSGGVSGNALFNNDLTVSGNSILNGKVGIGASNPQSNLSIGGNGVLGTGLWVNAIKGPYSSDTTGIYGNGSYYGIHGNSLRIGIYGTGNTGVYGEGRYSGVSGFSNIDGNSKGVEGITYSGLAGVRGYGQNNYGVSGLGGIADFNAESRGYRFPDGSMQTTSAMGGVCRFCESCGGAWPNNGGNARGNTGDSRGYGTSCSGATPTVALSRVQLCCK